MEAIFVSIETTGLRIADHELIQLNTLCGDSVEQTNIVADKEPDEKALKFNGLDPTIGLERDEFKKSFADVFKDKLVVLHYGEFTCKFLLDAGISKFKCVDLMAEAKSRHLPTRLNALAKHFKVEGTKCEKLKGVYEAIRA